MKAFRKTLSFTMMAIILAAAIAGGVYSTASAIVGVNTAPVGNLQAVTVTEDGRILIILAGTDAEGDALTFQDVVQPLHGTLSVETPGKITYSPWTNYSGPDSFTFVANDGFLDSAEATISITVIGVNDAPEAYPQYKKTTEDKAVAITLQGMDPDGDALSYAIVTGPAHGTLSGTAPALTYTPALDYFGSDSFTFTVSDGVLTSPVTTISLNISAVNEAPVADPQTVSVVEGTSISITLTGSDVDGDALAFIIVGNPANGSLSGTAPAVTYTPTSGFSGQDSFTFKTNDGNLDSATATVTIIVTLAPPAVLFWDDFETIQGWVRNPNGSDTATSGLWKRADPESSYYSGVKQLGTTVSGTYDLVTGLMAGENLGKYDVDGGVTSIRSPYITLPTGKNLVLSFKYYLAHWTNSSTSDYLRVKIVGATTTTILQELGSNENDNASWPIFSGSLNSFAGQTVYILIEVADYGTASLVEAAIDDVLITAQ